VLGIDPKALYMLYHSVTFPAPKMSLLKGKGENTVET
jgi:hypothetical protein